MTGRAARKRSFGRRADDVQPPHDQEAERNLLGALFADRADALVIAQQGLKSADDFYSPLNGDVYRKIAARHARGEGWDELTVIRDLEADGPLTDVQKVEISGLRDGIYKGAQVGEFARILAEHAQNRRLAEAGDRLFKTCHNGAAPESVNEIVARINEEHTAAGHPSARRLAHLRFSDHQPGAEPPAAFKNADGDVPLAEGDLVVVAGDSGSGKTLAGLDLGIAWTTGTQWLGFQRVDSRKDAALILTSDGDGADPVRARVVRLGLGRN